MKKHLSIILIIVLLTCLATACNDDTSLKLEFSFDSNGSYMGFNNLPKSISKEEANSNGYIIRQSGELGIVENEKLWDAFVKTAEKDKNSSIRMIYFSDDIDYPYITDLFFNDGFYYLFDSTANSFEKQPYKYLLTLEGQFGSPVRDSGVAILSDDNSLTFDTVMKTMLSSDMNYINSVSKFQIIMFH